MSADRERRLRGLQRRPARARHGRLGLRGAARGAGRGDRALQRPQAGDQRGADAHAGELSRRSSSEADLLVELIGGIEPAREYLLSGDARRQGRGQRQQAAALPARRGAVRDGPRARRQAALRGGGGGRGAGRARARGIAVGHADRAHPRDRQRHDELHPHRDGPGLDLRRRRSREAQRRGYAEADPSDDVSGRDAAAKMAILARLAFGTPVHLDDVRYEGIEHLHGDDLRVRARARSGAQADRHRRAPRGGLSVQRASRRSCTPGTRSRRCRVRSTP